MFQGITEKTILFLNNLNMLQQELQIIRLDGVQLHKTFQDVSKATWIKCKKRPFFFCKYIKSASILVESATPPVDHFKTALNFTCGPEMYFVPSPTCPPPLFLQ